MQLALAASNYNFGQVGHSPVPRKTGGPCSNPLRPKDPGVFERSHRFTVNRFRVARLHGRAGRLVAQSGGFWPRQDATDSRRSASVGLA